VRGLFLVVVVLVAGLERVQVVSLLGVLLLVLSTGIGGVVALTWRGGTFHGLSCVDLVLLQAEMGGSLWVVLTPKFGKESDLRVQLGEKSVRRKEGFFGCIRQKNPRPAICFRSARKLLS
jgi:hypothetical protein